MEREKIKTPQKIEIVDFGNQYKSQDIEMCAKVIEDTDEVKVIVISIIDNSIQDNNIYKIKFNVDKFDEKTITWLANVLASTIGDIILKCKKNTKDLVREKFKDFLSTFDMYPGKNF